MTFSSSILSFKERISRMSKTLGATSNSPKSFNCLSFCVLLISFAEQSKEDEPKIIRIIYKMSIFLQNLLI